VPKKKPMHPSRRSPVVNKRGKASKTTRTRSAKPPRASSVLAGSTDEGAASQRFVKDLLVRGEAARPDKKGKVPQHATHAIKGETPDGSVQVERVRFKTF
jgi:hypothetical protein